MEPTILYKVQIAFEEYGELFGELHQALEEAHSSGELLDWELEETNERFTREGKIGITTLLTNVSADKSIPVIWVTMKKQEGIFVGGYVTNALSLIKSGHIPTSHTWYILS